MKNSYIPLLKIMLPTFMVTVALSTTALAAQGTTALAAQGTTAPAAQEQNHFHEIDQPVNEETTVITPGAAKQQGNFIVLEKYQLRAGDKISETIGDWCRRNNWSLSWDAPERLSEADVDIEGNFESVVEMVMDALNRGGAKLGATFYDANRVLRITEKK